MAAEALLAKAADAFRRGFGGVLEIAPTGEPSFFIDGHGESCAVAAKPLDEAAACTWRAPAETLLRIFEGGRALESAYLSGRLHIAGDMSVMARLILESSQ